MNPGSAAISVFVRQRRARQLGAGVGGAAAHRPVPGRGRVQHPGTDSARESTGANGGETGGRIGHLRAERDRVQLERLECPPLIGECVRQLGDRRSCDLDALLRRPAEHQHPSEHLGRPRALHRVIESACASLMWSTAAGTLSSASASPSSSTQLGTLVGAGAGSASARRRYDTALSVTPRRLASRAASRSSPTTHGSPRQGTASRWAATCSGSAPTATNARAARSCSSSRSDGASS